MNKDLPQWRMCIMALLVGIVAGFGAVVFRNMIAVVHNALFLGHFSFYYDANTHTPNVFGIWIILAPVLGAIIVSFLIKRFAPEAKGHGVPEVMEAIYLKGGVIRPIVAAIKAIASSITIGSGGSVGREGPIIQIGSAFGSTIGSFLKASTKQRNILIAAGAAGGIAATFNTPIGAMAFVIELMMASITATSLFPVAIATVTATYIGRAMLGATPSFYVPILSIPDFHLMALGELTLFIPFGILAGLLSILFIKGLYWFEDRFDAIPGNCYFRHIVGMLTLGIIIYLMYTFTGHYYVQGVGYATIADILNGALNHPGFLLLLVLIKMLSTFLTLGSGGSGGIFSPSLFLGAALGGAFGIIAKYFFPNLPISPEVFAMAGMAGMVGGTTGAVLTGTFMVIEMTQNINIALPAIITVTTAYAIRKIICSESIYTLKLLRRGSVVPEGLQSAISLSQKASHIMEKDFKICQLENIENFLHDYLTGRKPRKVTLVVKEDHVVGILRRSLDKHALTNDPQENLDIFLNKKFLVFHSSVNMPMIMKAMEATGAQYTLVSSTKRGSKTIGNIIGVITENEILSASLQAVSLL